MNDQYLEEKYNGIRNAEYLKAAREDFVFYNIDIDQICTKLKANLEVGNFVNMYLAAISEKKHSKSWKELVKSTKDLELQI